MRFRLLAALLLVAGCTDDDPAVGSRAIFDTEAEIRSEAAFYDLPWPSDLRLEQDRPVVEGFVNREDNPLVAGLLGIASERRGWPTVPVGYFRFDAPLERLDATEVQPGGSGAGTLLLDVDPASPERGRTIPVVATTPPPDPYVPEHLLAVAPRPGFVLHPERTYAFVVTSALADREGRPVIPAEAFRTLRGGAAPPGPRGSEAQTIYAPLWPALDMAGVAREAVVSATVFTTGDVVADTAALTERVREAHDVTLESLAVDPDDGADHPRFCELHGEVVFPQFQRGTPPFDTEGVFEMDADGLPVQQRTETAKVVVALPNEPMPPEGFPLVMYFHGSGGVAEQVVDRGRVTEPEGMPTDGEGPAHVLAAHGFASVGSSHPVNPERLGGASDIAYLNVDNLKAFRDTFRQGVIEQRLYLDALLELTIDPQTVAACDGLALPPEATDYHFDPEPVLAMGQSMGGMYANLIGAVEPRIEAVVPTGAGGFWSFFILETTLVGGKGLLPLVLGSDPALTFLHPALSLLELAWEPAEPMVYMPRLSHLPLDGHPARPVYEPVGKGDSFFPTHLYDAMALAYGHEQAGEEVWPSMQRALALAGRDGLLAYPVADNLGSGEEAHTGVVVQYEGDGIYDPHAIFAQLDAVKHQYGCFFETILASGTATVPAPAELGTPCE